MRRKEKELEARERALEAREKAVSAREHALKEGSFSEAVQEKKEQWYDKVPLTVRQMDVIIYVVIGLLVIVGILIILEAVGIFRIAG